MLTSMVRMAVTRVSAPLGPPRSRVLAWLALASVVLPLPFVLAPVAVLVGAMIVSAAIAIGLAVAHRVRTRPSGWIVADLRGIRRKSAKKSEELARFDAPFGVTI